MSDWHRAISARAWSRPVKITPPFNKNDKEVPLLEPLYDASHAIVGWGDPMHRGYSKVKPG